MDAPPWGVEVIWNDGGVDFANLDLDAEIACAALAGRPLSLPAAFAFDLKRAEAAGLLPTEVDLMLTLRQIVEIVEMVALAVGCLFVEMRPIQQAGLAAEMAVGHWDPALPSKIATARSIAARRAEKAQLALAS